MIKIKISSIIILYTMFITVAKIMLAISSMIEGYKWFVTVLILIDMVVGIVLNIFASTIFDDMIMEGN